MSYPWNSFDTLTAGDLNAAIAMAASSGTTVAGGTNNVGRNLIHNSMFNIAQRGTGPWTSSGNYAVDRWVLVSVTDVLSVSQFAIADGGRAQIGDEEAAFGLNNTFTGNAAASAFTQIAHRIENVRRLAGKTVILSFWAQSPNSLKLGINLVQNFGTGGSPSAGVIVLATGASVTLSTTWTRYSVTIALPSVAGKTFGTTARTDFNNLQFWYSSGATNNAQAGNIGVQGPNVQINLWGVQLELGTVATPLEKLDPVTQLQQCQRFFQIGNWLVSGYNTAGATTNNVMHGLPVSMRADPQVGVLGTPTLTNCTLPGLTVWGPAQFAAYCTVTAAGTFQAYGGFTASADL